jgi:hypothetical protein
MEVLLEEVEVAEEAVEAVEVVVFLGMPLPLECLDSNQVHNTQVHRDTFRNLHSYMYKEQVVVEAVEAVEVECLHYKQKFQGSLCKR